MTRGRKADAGTYEARELITNGTVEKTLNSLECSPEAKARLLKAVKFGLGIKEVIAEAKINVKEQNPKTKQKIKEPVKEKKTPQKNLDDSGDEYFKPEDCQEVEY